jgi:hypothetical protein
MEMIWVLADKRFRLLARRHVHDVLPAPIYIACHLATELSNISARLIGSTGEEAEFNRRDRRKV